MVGWSVGPVLHAVLPVSSIGNVHGKESGSMIKSMTGYGRRTGVWNGMSITVEMKSVNHRFCEVICRLPKGLGRLEEALKQTIRQQCERGRIELTVSVVGSVRRQGEWLDLLSARRYYEGLRRLQRALRLPGTIDIALMAGFRELFAASDMVFDERAIGPVIHKLASGALKDLARMRCQEGKSLLRDLTARLRVVKRQLDQIKRRTPRVVSEHMTKMKARLAGLIEGGHLDTDRLEQEVVIFADRCDVTEELIRLESHLTQFRAALTETGPVGRRLDFLLQEMGREVNTIGSKANDAAIALAVVEVKSELEKMREQVQNIE
ncbi:MAG: YicC family protein [Nitrospirae bacterium]|nr:MAG: YicC family protein [Nitrospirota bacterium]